MDAGELDVGLGGGGDDEAVDDTFGDDLGEGVSEEGLCVHGGCVWGRCIRGIRAHKIDEDGVSKLGERDGRGTDDISGPAVDELLQA